VRTMKDYLPTERLEGFALAGADAVAKELADEATRTADTAC
jgi:hypothetical protein